MRGSRRALRRLGVVAALASLAVPSVVSNAPSTAIAGELGGSRIRAVSSPVTSGSAVVVRAAGDIACDPADPYFAGGSPRKCQQRGTAKLLRGADVVFAVGDTQYICGGARAYRRSYDRSWGTRWGRTFAVPGDQEYETSTTQPNGTDCSSTSDAAGYYAYFGNRGGSTNATPRAGVDQSSLPGVYSLNLPLGCTPGAAGTCTWHIIALNSVCTAVGGCGQGKPMEQWLREDLSANAWAGCSLALIHVPMFASKANGRARISLKYEALWQAFVSGGVDLVLSGNSHFYERFAPQDSDGSYDPDGTVQWVIGTGGKSLARIARSHARLPNSVSGQSRTFGVLQLRLASSRYAWRYLPLTGSFSDEGSATCT